MSDSSALNQLLDYLNITRDPRNGSFPEIVCANGFKMSVQASRMHYCSPRDNVGPWRTVEIGSPNRIEPLLWDYAVEPGKWTETVYGYVPVELVAAVIEVHGGFASQT